ncbi:hypothetical protein HZP35_15260 [Elizabethkingia anophelis]|nr:hypothetical protein [Elizabethkingia anophelis]MCT4156296.1 hypothetical protein [Elizabethkingia anophelis]MCT4170620.1 hypothetical protein [Elizabethkingia anophelis]MCT4245036.1 hypothetical protein [Elizabethkingia anophelis]MCT4248843.1 hypothetical protein [Elizabethkingia anophelis]
MINYNINSKHITDDPFGIEKVAYKAMEDKLLEMVKSQLLPFEVELAPYNVDVNIDLNEGAMNITSDFLPEDLRSRVQSSLDQIGN